MSTSRTKTHRPSRSDKQRDTRVTEFASDWLSTLREEEKKQV
jgi:hypothetical protein